MPLSAEDLAQLDDVINQRVNAQLAASGQAPAGPQTNDEAQNQPENQPLFYLHLSDGSVIQSANTGSHMANDSGETCLVIGRFPVMGSDGNPVVGTPESPAPVVADNWPLDSTQGNVAPAPSSGTPVFPSFT